MVLRHIPEHKKLVDLRTQAREHLQRGPTGLARPSAELTESSILRHGLEFLHELQLIGPDLSHEDLVHQNLGAAIESPTSSAAAVVE